jgi:hypothetical protein
MVARAVLDRRSHQVYLLGGASEAILGCIGMDCSYWTFMMYPPLYFSAGLGYDTTTAGLALVVYTVPFLVMPPIAQWLLLRYQPRFVTPAGLFLIGLGFALMKLGSSLTHLGGWTVLPGGRHQSGPNHHARDQHDHRLGACQPRRHGLGHGRQRTPHHPGRQHRSDVAGARGWHHGRAAHGTGASLHPPHSQTHPLALDSAPGQRAHCQPDNRVGEDRLITHRPKECALHAIWRFLLGERCGQLNVSLRESTIKGHDLARSERRHSKPD